MHLFGVPRDGAHGPMAPKFATADGTAMLHTVGFSTIGYRLVYRLSAKLEVPLMNMRRYSCLTRVARVALLPEHHLHGIHCTETPDAFRY